MGFVQRRLHWVIAAVFFALYFLTLNPWVTSSSLISVAKVTDWNWSPQVSNPLLYLVTLPVRWVPASLQPIVLNLMAALLGALALGQLVRSVSLLPHDRTRDQRQRERSDYSILSASSAWMPPLFASLICGLQLTFWEESTAFTGDILSVFVFAYLVRCVLEFRLFQEDRWLYRLAFVFGFAVPCDWAFIGYLPLFACAIIWTKGVETFRPAFMLKMFSLGAIGLSTYALLPLVILYNNPGAGSFFDLLKLLMGTQKAFLLGVPKTVLILLSLTSLLPVVVMGIRFPSSIGDVSVVGAMLSNFMFRAMHLLFLGACVWVAFDPAFSPRNVARVLPVNFLTFYYLGALAVGYFAGYILLVFGRMTSHSHRRNSQENRFLNMFVTSVLWVAVAVSPLGLLLKNLPSIRLINGDQFGAFGEMLVRHLPEEKTLILSDDSYSTLVVRSELARQGLERDYVIIDMSSLGIGYYEENVRARLAFSWPNLFSGDAMPSTINVVSLLNVLGKISSESPIFYLNSSFGLYFEIFYPRQRGLVTELIPYQEVEVSPPSLPQVEISNNQAFWEEMAEKLRDLPLGLKTFDKGSRMIGSWASREQNVWGVTLQQEEKTEEAKLAFERAQRWNPQNTCAAVNLRQNEVLLGAGDSNTVGLTPNEVQAVQQNYGTFEQLLSANGPIDEASFRLLMAAEFTGGQNHRQAVHNYKRAAALDPENVETKLLLANSYLMSGFAGSVLGQIAEIKKVHPSLDPAARSELIRLEALGHYGIGNKEAAAGNKDKQTESFAVAEGLLVAAVTEDPANGVLLETLYQVYLLTSRYAEALILFDQHLEISPDDPKLLQNKALAHMRLGQYGKAIAPLTLVLSKDPANAFARLNRAISYYREGDDENAKLDYQLVAETLPNHPAIHFGLGRIAERLGDKAAAMLHFAQYLEHAPKETDEYREIGESLSTLKGQ
ncbi:tetratricopeptide repeat protein [bacterium]|nr:tetratricopeptide repeat protein [bacterium]